MMARQYLIELANKVEEEMMWSVELEDKDVAKRQANEKEKEVRRQAETEMRTT